MKNLLVFIASIISLNVYSQISFEKGYYINNSNERIDCLIKNIEWKNNPTEFEYKLSENKEQAKLGIESVSEFGIDNQLKYLRQTVNIDISSDNIYSLSKTKSPIFIKQELFLKVLLEGQASLFLYESSTLKRYFYVNENNSVEQLVYKNYLISDIKIAENITFKQQLWNSLKCDKISMNDVKNIEYKKNDLIKLFIKYNSCVNAEVINYVEKQKRDQFNLTIRPGLNYSSLRVISSRYPTYDVDFENQAGFRIGIEAEYILPFNKNKWSVFLEPTYQYYKTEIERIIILQTVVEVPQSIKADYKSIEIPIGVRHYFYLNKKSVLFANAALVLDVVLPSSISYDPGIDLEIYPGGNFAVGVGFRYDAKFSIESRYQTGRDILSDDFYLSSKYNSFSVIFGYTLF